MKRLKTAHITQQPPTTRGQFQDNDREMIRKGDYILFQIQFGTSKES